jgi:hypothetical protein
MSDFNYDGPGASQIDNFEGGAPSSRDIVPAIIFTVLVSTGFYCNSVIVGARSFLIKQLGLTIPLLAWRMFSGKHKSYILVNSVMFFLTRLVSQILRAYMSRHSYGPNIVSEWTLHLARGYHWRTRMIVVTHETVAETVLMTIGWLFLLNGLIDLLQRHVLNAREEAEEYHPHDRNLVEHKQRNVRWIQYLSAYVLSLDYCPWGCSS